MITIICAYHDEGKQLIQHYHMKRTAEITAFPVFLNEDNSIRLIVSGPGIRSAIALTHVLTRLGSTTEDHLFCFGTAAGHPSQINTLFLIHKITDITTEKTYYPDMLYRSTIPETELYTSPYILTDIQQTMEAHHISNPMAIWDMEGSYVYQAAEYFYTQERMHFLKIISDAGTNQFLSSPSDSTGLEHFKEMIQHSIQEQMPQITAFMDSTQTEKEMPLFTQAQEEYIQQFCKDLHASTTMAHQIRQLFLFCSLQNIPIWQECKRLYQQEILPCISKKEGLKLYHALKQRII